MPRLLASVLTMFLTVLLASLLTACGSDDDQPAAGSPSAGSTTSDDSDNSSNPCLETDTTTPENPGSEEEVTEQYIGLTEEEAKKLAKDEAHTIRVAGRDGECFALTMDYREDRVNIYLEDGTVIAATRG